MEKGLGKYIFCNYHLIVTSPGKLLICYMKKDKNLTAFLFDSAIAFCE